MLKVSRFIIRLLKCLICILTGEYKDRDRKNGFVRGRDRDENTGDYDREKDKL